MDASTPSLIFVIRVWKGKVYCVVFFNCVSYLGNSCKIVFNMDSLGIWCLKFVALFLLRYDVAFSRKPMRKLPSICSTVISSKKECSALLANLGSASLSKREINNFSKFELSYFGFVPLFF